MCFETIVTKRCRDCNRIVSELFRPAICHAARTEYGSCGDVRATRRSETSTRVPCHKCANPGGERQDRLDESAEAKQISKNRSIRDG